MKKLFADFKKFITRGNVIDMAVGVIIGGAFTKIVNSFVNDIFTPLINLATGSTDLTGFKISLNGEPLTIIDNGLEIANPNCISMNIGNVIDAIVNFLMIAVILFAIIKIISKLHEIRTAKEAEALRLAELKKQEEEANKPKPITTEDLLVEIRDILKDR